MNIKTVSPLNTHQNPPIESMQSVVIVCDVANYQALAAVSAYLQSADLLIQANVQVVPPAVYANEKIQEILAADQEAGRIGFVMVKGDNACRHYFKTPEETDFSLHITPLQ
jgi:hypothetical protein